MKVTRTILLVAMFAVLPTAAALSGAAGVGPLRDAPTDSAIIKVDGLVRGKAGKITPKQTRTVLKRYRSIPGDGMIKGKARAITPKETRTVIKRYRSIPGDGMIRGKARAITPKETRTVLKRYRSIPGDGMIRGKARTITPKETRMVIKRYHSIPGDGMIRGKARAITPKETRTVLKRYRSIPGGLLLEGGATGLPRFKSVRYDAAANAFVFDGRITYASPVDATAGALLARAVAGDDRVGVSLGEETNIVYGKMPEESDAAVEMMMTDNFLGDLVLPPREWTVGYKLANNFEPRTERHRDIAIFFRFSDYRFETKSGKIELIGASFDARLVPVLKTAAKDGGYLPDMKAIEEGRVPEDYLVNASHIADNINYYIGEDVIGNSFSYGQTAAFFRALKAARVDLRALSRTMETAAASKTTRRYGDEAALDDNWQEYLKGIQARNRFANWSGPPADLYAARVKNDMARAPKDGAPQPQ